MSFEIIWFNAFWSIAILFTGRHRKYKSGSILHWSYGVTVSTLDSESSNRGSNPRRTFFLYRKKICLWQNVSDNYCRVLQTVEMGNQCLKRYLYFSVMCQVFPKRFRTCLRLDGMSWCCGPNCFVQTDRGHLRIHTGCRGTLPNAVRKKKRPTSKTKSFKDLHHKYFTRGKQGSVTDYFSFVRLFSLMCGTCREAFW